MSAQLRQDKRQTTKHFATPLFSGSENTKYFDGSRNKIGKESSREQCKIQIKESMSGRIELQGV